MNDDDDDDNNNDDENNEPISSLDLVVLILGKGRVYCDEAFIHLILRTFVSLDEIILLIF